jgi:hypothetical protein
VGKSDVDVSAIIAPGETRGKMAADGENIRLGELTFFSYGVIQVSETNLSKLRLGTSSPRNGY